MNKQSMMIHANQVVEPGKATVLTLGNGHRSFENNWRSRGGLAFNEKKSVIMHVVELGNVASLTLGGYGQSTEHIRSNQHRKA